MFASLYIPDFAMAAALRSRPKDRKAPCAILSSSSGKVPQDKLPLLAVNGAARQAGIGEGWPLNRSLVRCPSLKVIPADPDAEASLRAELVDLGESLTPDLELAAVDAVILDLSRRKAPEGGALERLSLADAELWHALAATPDLAHLAAREGVGELVGAPRAPFFGREALSRRWSVASIGGHGLFCLVLQEGHEQLVGAHAFALRAVEALEQGGDDAFLDVEFGLEGLDLRRESGNLLLGRFDTVRMAKIRPRMKP